MKKNLHSSFIVAIFAFLSAAATYASTTVVDDTSGSITYNGIWTLGFSFAGCYNGTESFSNATNAYDQFTFTGTSIIWVGARWNNRGMTDVYIDGVYQGRVDAYSASNLLQQNLYEKTGLTNGSHTIKLVCTGVKNPSSSDYYTDVDQFTYTNGANWTGTKVDDTSASLTYNTAWGFVEYPGTYDSSESFSATLNDNAQFIFTGTSIRWIGALWSDRGQTGVYIDGVLQMNVDAYSASDLLQQVLFERTGLSNASHTIKLVCLHTHNASSSNYYSDVDAFEYGTGTWTADVGFSSIQGANQWYYQQRPIGGGAVTNIAWTSTGGYSDPIDGSTGFYSTPEAVNSGYLYWHDASPGSSYDTIRKWTAPLTGTISIRSQVFKESTAGGGGIIASVEKNGTSIWSKTVAYNDIVGYSTNADLSAVSVSSGDSIAFVVDDNGSYGPSQPQTGWDPTISYSSGSPSWSLNTSDTLLTLSINSNLPVITLLEDAATGWNWVPSPVVIPLVSDVYIGATEYHPNWTYTTAAVSTTSGTKVSLTFTSTTPSLSLTQIWWARSGVGPIEQTTSITNNSGSGVTYNDTAVVATDLTVTADNTVTLWRFDRASVGAYPGGDTTFTTGVLKTAMGASTSVASTISNNTSPSLFVLPFEILDVGGAHGLYIGYECDFGLFNTATSGNALQVTNVFYLWNSNSFSQATGTTLALPGIFYGAYKGSTDVGSNKMKKWFWDNKMTPTIKSTTNEPLVESCIFTDSAAQTATFFADDPSMATWGVELAKEDQGWTNDTNTDPPFGWDWSPNASYWPNGINLGTLVHAQGMKLALYMANRYNHVDLSTAAGVSSEETAAETRFNGTATGFVGPGYDYWRTDIDFESPTDYLSHLGFLQVMDYMISNHSNFRWENCSGGGSKKSFDLLQRQSNLCVDDSGAAPLTLEYYRMAYYGNSYMINPVQLQLQNANLSANTLALCKYMFRTGQLGGWMYTPGSGDTFFQPTEYQTEIAQYKSHQRPILRGADTYHILPFPDATHWDGMEFFNSALNKGSVILLKPNSSVSSSPTIVLQGLIPTNTYSLKFQDRSGLSSSYTSVSGSTLMTTGIGAISGTANEYDSEIIWINY